MNNGVEIKAKFGVRDFFLLLAMLGVGGNLYWCWTHEKEIQQLRQDQRPTQSYNVTPK